VLILLVEVKNAFDKRSALLIGRLKYLLSPQGAKVPEARL